MTLADIRERVRALPSTFASGARVVSLEESLCLLAIADEVYRTPVNAPHVGVVEHPGDYIVITRADWKRIADALAALEALP